MIRSRPLAQLFIKVGLFFLVVVPFLSIQVMATLPTADQNRLSVLLTYQYAKESRAPAAERNLAIWNVSQYRHRAGRLIDINDQLLPNQSESCQRFLRILSNVHRQLGQELMSYEVTQDPTTRVLLEARVGILQKMNSAMVMLMEEHHEGGTGLIIEEPKLQCQMTSHDRAEWEGQAHKVTQRLKAAVDLTFGAGPAVTYSLNRKLRGIQEEVAREGQFKLAAVLIGQLGVSVLVWNRFMPVVQRIKQERIRAKAKAKLEKSKPPLKARLAKICRNQLTGPVAILFSVSMVEMFIWNFLTDQVFFMGDENFSQVHSLNSWLKFMRESEGFLSTPLNSPHTYSAFYDNKTDRDLQVALQYVEWAEDVVNEEMSRHGSLDEAIQFYQKK